MKHIFLAVFCIALIFTSSCEDNYFDPLGDLIIQLRSSNDLPNNPMLNALELGVFPSESLLTNTFTSDLAFKISAIDTSRDTEITRVVFTNILPGTYVVAFISPSPGQNVPKQVVQVIADKVTVADLYY